MDAAPRGFFAELHPAAACQPLRPLAEERCPSAGIEGLSFLRPDTWRPPPGAGASSAAVTLCPRPDSPELRRHATGVHDTR